MLHIPYLKVVVMLNGIVLYMLTVVISYTIYALCMLYSCYNIMLCAA